jgi:hypothetical protein
MKQILAIQDALRSAAYIPEIVTMYEKKIIKFKNNQFTCNTKESQGDARIIMKNKIPRKGLASPPLYQFFLLIYVQSLDNIMK